VISDITGETGLAILEAIVKGQRDGMASCPSPSILSKKDW
jgi:hypothetical protein